MSEQLKVLVLQNGARHNYAVPSALAKQGMLAGFYTDACGNEGLGRMATALSGLPRVGRSLRLLSNRQVPAEVLSLTTSFPLSSCADHLFSDRISSPWVGKAMGLAGLKGGDLIYSSMGWARQYLRQARIKGVPIVTEFYVRPSLWKVHQKEYHLFPSWEEGMPFRDFLDCEDLRRGPCNLADDLIVPDSAVKEDLIHEGLFPAHRIHIVPYGTGELFFHIENRPVEGRVLFVGSCTIIKGFHYLAMASQQISRQEDSRNLQFVAAGGVSDRVRQQPTCSAIQFLGRVPRDEVNKLYETADVVVFPSLSDSFGAVIVEAMAAGIPVICSPYCSNVVEDGISGFVVEPRDTGALAKAIVTLTGNRELRRRMSVAARERALQFTWEKHGDRLVRTLQSLNTVGGGQ